MKKYFVVLSFIVFLLLTGSMGFNTDYTKCVSMPNAEKITCYREIAVTYAFKMNRSESTAACEKISSLQGTDPSYIETQKNLCYYDIAKIFVDPTLCGGIAGGSVADPLLGTSATTEMCKKEISQTSNIAANYTCGVIFIFPLILLYSFWYRVH